MLWTQIRIKTPPDLRIPMWLLSGHNKNNNNTAVIDAPQSGLKGLSQTLNKTIKMRYNAQV
jgi:hypothetical protein